MQYCFTEIKKIRFLALFVLTQWSSSLQDSFLILSVCPLLIILCTSASLSLELASFVKLLLIGTTECQVVCRADFSKKEITCIIMMIQEGLLLLSDTHQRITMIGINNIKKLQLRIYLYPSIAVCLVITDDHLPPG